MDFNPVSQVQSYAQDSANQAANDAFDNKQIKRRIFYVIIATLILALPALLGFVVARSPLNIFMATQCYMLLMGLLHFMAMDKMLAWKNPANFLNKLLFSLLITVIAAIVYCIVFYFTSKSAIAFSFVGAILGFILPVLFSRTFQLAYRIPAKEYKMWLYPDKPIVIDMDNIDVSNFAILTFVFSKKFGDTVKSNLQSKAPYELKLGDLFFSFIKEWNYRNAENTIQYMDDDNKTFGWLFFVKDKWYSPKQYLDPDKTIRENKIKVNQIVQTERVKID
jgi:Type VI secretion system, TssN